MKTASIVSLLAIVWFIASPAQAQFYRYQDSHGNVIFTDDLNTIPVDKREQAKAYQESETETPAPTQLDEADNTPEDTSESIRKEGQKLQERRDTLEQEYNALVEENSTLRKEQKQAVTPDQINAVNKKVVSFNARFKAYEEKSEAFKSQLEAYNRRVAAAEAKNKP